MFSKQNQRIHSKLAVKLPKMRDYLSWAELFHGVGIFGNSGSGKTSGPLSHILRNILTNETRPGGLILCVKKDDRIRLEQLIYECGRGNDLIIVDEHSSFNINPLEYELFRKGRNQIDYNQALDVLMELFLLGEHFQAGGSSSGENERFWDKSLRRLLTRLMMLLVLAEEPITIYNMRRLLVNMFDENEVARYISLWEKIQNGEDDEQDKALSEYINWRTSNYFLYCFDKADAREDLIEEELDTIKLVGDYFFKVWVKVSEKTKAIVVESAMGLFEPFTTAGILKQKFSSTMSPELRPERCFEEGAIILIDVPIKEHGISSIYANGIFKKLFMLAVERRVVSRENNARPCYLYLDEYHFLCSPQSDDRFQSSCRSTMCASIYATQSINNIKTAMGKNNAEAKTKALLTNWGTQIYCANTCRDTNQHAANLIGKQFIQTTSSSFDTNERFSESQNEQLHYIVPPEHFASDLRTGGSENHFKVDTITVVSSKKWSTGENFREITFEQNHKQKTFWQTFKSLVNL